MPEALAIVSLIVSIVSLLSIILLAGVWKGGVDTFIKEVKLDRDKYPPAESYKMLTTLWQTYVVDPLSKRSDLASYHSPCILTEKGLKYISEETKTELDEIHNIVSKREDLTTGYIIVEHFGLERLNKMAEANKLTLQEYIAILSTYLANCKM